MERELIVNYHPYHSTPVKPRNFLEFCQMYETQGRITGLWCFQQIDLAGNVIKELWNSNIVTDFGADNFLRRGMNSASATLPGIFNNILITNNSGSTTLTTAIAASTSNITSLAVAALPASIPSGTILTLGFGSAINQNVTVSSTASQGATSISVNSFSTDASHSYPIGTAVVPQPNVTDNPTNAQLTNNVSPAVSFYSGNLPTGAFTYTPTSGTGNRSAVISFQFTSAGGAPTGNYTDAWITNVSSGATSGNYLAHKINSPMRIDATNNLTVTVTIRL